MTDTADAPAGSITFDEVDVPTSALTLEGFRASYAVQEARGLQASWVRGRVYVERVDRRTQPRIRVPRTSRTHRPSASSSSSARSRGERRRASIRALRSFALSRAIV